MHILYKHDLYRCCSWIIKLNDLNDPFVFFLPRHGFNVDQILNTKLALQRKYKIGEVLDYCQEYLNNLNDLMKILTPVAVRASLLMTLSIKMNTVIKGYDFALTFIEHILLSMSELVKVETKVIINSFNSFFFHVATFLYL